MLYEVIDSEMLEGVLSWVEYWIKNYFEAKSVAYGNNSILLNCLELLE